MRFSLSTLITSLFFPPTCAKCQREGFLLCDACRSSFPAELVCWCPACCRTVENSHDVARHGFAFSAVYSLIPYHEPWMERTVQDMKFGGMYRYARMMGTRLGERIAPLFSQEVERAVLVPLPLHKKRERERGFNQAMELARGVAQTSNIPIINILERARKTQAQAKLKEADRWENTKGAFRLSQQKRNKGVPTLARRAKTVILVDDVMTTGATLSSAAETLRASGVSNVIALTIAYSDIRKELQEKTRTV